MTPRCWLAALPPDLRLPPIIEIKRRLDGSQVDFDCQGCLIAPGRHAAIVYRIETPWTHAYANIHIPTGAYSFGYFWSGWPYNLYHWIAPGGETIGSYFNLAGETRITTGVIEWLDLVIDYWLTPRGEGMFLDEDELPASLDGAIRLQIEAGQRELVSKARRLAQHLDWLSRSYLAQINQQITPAFSH